MARINLFIVALAALVIVIRAVPVGVPALHFTLRQVPNPEHIARSPEEIYARALAKYGYDSPAILIRESAPLNGSVITNPEKDDESYLSPVTVGGQTMLVNIDTGSSDFWVFSSLLRQNQKEGHIIYTPGPEARELVNHTWDIGYGDGSFAFGKVFLDKVELGGISVPDQAVEAATRVSPTFVEDRNNSGIMGLGFGNLNMVRPRKQKTFFENAMAHLSMPVLAASLKHGAPGTYDFGFIDRKKYAGELAYLPVDNTEGYWNVTVAGYQIGRNGNKMNITFSALADTGTTLALLPEPIVNAYYSQVTGAEHVYKRVWYFPCNVTVPDFGLVINDNYTAFIPGEFVKYATPSVVKESCYGGIQASRNGAILGGMFLKSQYAVFDYGQVRLGLAPQAEGNKTCSKCLVKTA
ncbi:hypothetical protein LOZ12_002140 [Ophidiomyces ophidiicola]|uniref:Uncharacterized protein n=1 Tax=Ophidiomyces ophidiicola TaxID=1387563 RepID=A0ACB8UYJ8_9EURO|nr:hypothetical protein LOZ64_001416 [Ophidiomyces ophidiicola]KAI1949369.1 hypothetical protein LOZ62_002333 [Ophidiomyces ophidiicola]KAI1971361.1 hypothetical protein LOZ56_003061 [Ophidiomyces ophidiicola]KAI2005960.1 hypothetical protein LOZ50_003351 [Ophidiomyces ophidiicola]KAI2029764.1 hypothetical protein LOZ48_003478 [Ophidiomyces ophidiicola]